jgi:hypothetical protein
MMMSIHLGSTNLNWFDIARDEIAGTTLFNKKKSLVWNGLRDKNFKTLTLVLRCLTVVKVHNTLL